MSIKKASLMVVFWIVAAMVFNAVVYVISGQQRAVEFLGGYLIELSLSVDNLFLFLVLFQSFGIEPQYQPRCLNYGIAIVLILRFLFIFIGIELVHMFHWLLYVMGAVLLFSGLKLLIKGDQDEGKSHKDSKILKLLSKFVPITYRVTSDRFFIRKRGITLATPLFAVLVLMNILDIVFAMDSVPAVFSVTTDLFVVYSSNILAVMGLRSFYYILEHLSHIFLYLKQGVAVILAFTGLKMVIVLFGIEISSMLSVGIILGILAASMLLSVAKRSADKRAERAA